MALAAAPPADAGDGGYAAVAEFKLVDDTPVSVPNPIVDGRTFVKQGGNRFFTIEPAVVHFGGFALNRTHTQTLRVKNVSGKSRRIRILEPTTSFFTVRMSKVGLVAPGMSEEVLVEFTPNDLRYYYDCVRLHSEGENLMVPCHGYPVMNEVELPTNVDLGSCPINELKFRTVELACKTPINFEFDCEVVEAHPEIEITPLKGTVPALGSVSIELRYRPTTFRTALMRFRVRISQFGFEPVTVTVRGNCQPGLLKETALRDTMGERLAATERIGPGQTRESFGRPAGQTTGSIGGGSNYFSADNGADMGNTGGGGGGRQDLVSSHQAAQQRLERSQRLSETSAGGHRTQVLETKFPDFRPPTPDETVEGIRFPPNVLTHAAVANVLTQEAGKLKIRDLKKAIDEAKAKAEKEAAELAQATQSDAAGAPPDDSMGRQLKETVFERKFQGVAEFERSKEIKWFECIGDANMTPEEIEQATQQQAEREHRDREKREQEDRQRKQTELLADRPVFPHGVPPEGSPVWPESAREEQVRHFGLERFVDAVRVVVIHNRADVRLAKLRAMFERLGVPFPKGLIELGEGSPGPPLWPADEAAGRPECAFGREDLELGREEIGKLVELWDDQEAMHAAIGDTDGDGDVDADDRVALRFAVETTQRFAFPSYRESEFTDREPIDTMETIPLFEELDTFPLKVPQEASMMGYRVWETPVLPFHFPASVVPDVRVGAQEESIIRKGCRLPEDMQQASAAIAKAGMPSHLHLPVRPRVSSAKPRTVRPHRLMRCVLRASKFPRCTFRSSASTRWPWSILCGLRPYATRRMQGRARCV